MAHREYGMRFISNFGLRNFEFDTSRYGVRNEIHFEFRAPARLPAQRALQPGGRGLYPGGIAQLRICGVRHAATYWSCRCW
jgi:hypothetical protein